MPVEDFIIYVYCCVCDCYEKVAPNPLRKRGFPTKLSDCEAITMEIVGEFMGKDQDKGIWEYFRNHWHGLFPNLGSRSSFVKQAANLWVVKERILGQLARQLGADTNTVHLVDGFPMPVCKITRAARSRCFRTEAGYGYCAAKDEKYYGFEGHLLTDSNGIICGFAFANASIDERDVVPELAEGLGGWLIGDKGYIRPWLGSELAKRGISLQTPLRKNMDDPRPKAFVRQLTATRRLVETVIGQLTERFHIERIRARNLWHLANRVIRKLLAHTVGVFLNCCLGRHQPLQFEGLVQI
jgi:hypothetical protein